jgi:hypothetical protein
MLDEKLQQEEVSPRRVRSGVAEGDATPPLRHALGTLKCPWSEQLQAIGLGAGRIRM